MKRRFAQFLLFHVPPSWERLWSYAVPELGRNAHAERRWVKWAWRTVLAPRPQASYWPRWYWVYRRIKHWLNEVLEP